MTQTREQEIKKEIEIMEKKFNLDSQYSLESDSISTIEKWLMKRAELKGITETNSKWQEAVQKLKEVKIIKDEFCQCGCSKKAHTPHQLDKNGGRCGICIHCEGYTWKGFEFLDIKDEIDEIFGGLK